MISEALMWHQCGIQKESGIFACQKMRKKKQDQLLLSNTFSAYNMEVLGHFDT